MLFFIYLHFLIQMLPFLLMFKIRNKPFEGFHHLFFSKIRFRKDIFYFIEKGITISNIDRSFTFSITPKALKRSILIFSPAT